ncbi:MAG: hypothetical protein RIS92_2855 [Verrucomicrobiota bacterium]|jgi:hypothetical protein
MRWTGRRRFSLDGAPRIQSVALIVCVSECAGLRARKNGEQLPQTEEEREKENEYSVSGSSAGWDDDGHV